MTVAPELPPELPPASAPRRRPAEPSVVPPARAARRHPFGAAAHATTRSATPVVRPLPRRSPERPAPDVPTDRELAALVGLPDPDRGPRTGRATELPGEGAGREHRPAAPVRLRPVDPRPVGARVVRSARPRPRLTRRGRALAAAVGLLALLTTSLAVTERMQALHEPASVVPATAPAEVVVAPGETLWSIAERVAPDRDPRGVVDQIRRINDLPGGDVQAGQTLRLRTP
jgi:hypothetical protein